MGLPKDESSQHECAICTISFAVGLAWEVPDPAGWLSLLPEYQMVIQQLVDMIIFGNALF